MGRVSDADSYGVVRAVGAGGACLACELDPGGNLRSQPRGALVPDLAAEAQGDLHARASAIGITTRPGDLARVTTRSVTRDTPDIRFLFAIRLLSRCASGERGRVAGRLLLRNTLYSSVC